MSFIKVLAIAALFCVSNVQAEEKKKKGLPELKAKQSLDNIRFISKEGRYTYYQRRSGDLQMSTNYSNDLVMEGEKLSDYLLISSPARRKIAILKDESFHTDLSHHKTGEIHLVDFGKTEPRYIADGITPKLHLKDLFLSYFLPRDKTVKIHNLASNKKPISIKLLNPLNPFFKPQVFMPTPNDVIHSDINESGHEAFLIRSILDGKTKPVFKSAYPGSKLEACLIGEDLYVGEFERASGKGGSKIVKIPLYGNEDFQKYEVLYQSQQADIGNMACSEGKIYFVKTLSYVKELNLKESEIAALDLATKKVEVLTDLKRVTQIVQMDGMILSPFRGKYYIVKGGANLADDSIGSANPGAKSKMGGGK